MNIRKTFFTLLSGTVLVFSCKEKHDAVNVTPTPSSNDTTYVVTPIPAADAHNVLVEEFTGQNCNNCPIAHNLLDSIAVLHSGHVNSIGYYFYGGTPTNPVAGSSHDFRDSTSNSVANAVFGGVSGIPIGGVDRVPGTNSPPLEIGYTGWSDAINTGLGVADSMNLKLESAFDNSTSTASIKATVTYTKAVNIPQNLTVVIVEDSIVDKQEFPTTIQDNYVFTDVFRAMITNAPFGNPLQVAGSDNKEAGRLFQRIFTYKPKTITPAIVPKHCRVIAFVNTVSGSDYHVAQSVQCKMVP